MSDLARQTASWIFPCLPPPPASAADAAGANRAAAGGVYGGSLPLVQGARLSLPLLPAPGVTSPALIGLPAPRAAGGEDEESPGAGDEGGLALEESKPELKRPPLYKVVLLNDDYTPMEFVVEVLELFFKMNREQATQIMLTVHTQGRGVCGIYTRDIAETKAAQVNQYARDHQHPLLCEIEASED